MAIYATETHGTKGLVSFIQKNGTTETKEIADLQILCFDSATRSIKISYLQAKFSRKNHIGKAISSFDGDALQWDLLNYRPKVTALKGSIIFPSDILSHSRLDSIGGFGVFYYKKYRGIDLVYSAASKLSLSPRGGKNYTKDKCKRVIYSDPKNGFQNNIINQEALVKESLQGYIESLLRFEIGSPILTSPNVIAYVYNLLINIARYKNFEGNHLLLRSMLGVFIHNDFTSDESFNNKGYMRTLLIESNSENLFKQASQD